MHVVKTYCVGFIKGIGIIILYYLISILYIFLISMLQNIPLAEVGRVDGLQIQVVNWLFGLAVVFYLVNKHKLMKAWLLLGMLFTILTVPFLMGNIELQKKQ